MRATTTKPKSRPPLAADAAGKAREGTAEETAHLMRTMTRALCRQHIMWPADGPLPCEKQQPCDKSDRCRAMAEEVILFSKSIKAESRD